jgi:[ribosomal protein S5]-alanine N-acetyltransferase
MSLQFETIETPRLLLRTLTPDIYIKVLEDLSDEQLMEFTGYTRPEDIAKERARQYGGLSSYAMTFLYWHALDKETQKVIGSIGYYRVFPEHERGEIGYNIYDEANRRKGYMKELMPIVLAYGFETMKLHRIEAMISPGNEASIGLIEKFGFVKEGLMREHFKREDSLVYSLLSREWIKYQ